MFHKQPAGAALDELDSESIQAGESAFGRRDQRYFPSAVHVGEESAIRNRDLDDPGGGSPERALLLISADVLRKNSGSDLYLAFPFVRSLAHPVFQAVAAFVANPFQHFGIGGKFGPDGDSPGPRVGRRVRECNVEIEIAEVG